MIRRSWWCIVCLVVGLLSGVDSLRFGDAEDDYERSSLLPSMNFVSGNTGGVIPEDGSWRPHNGSYAAPTVYTSGTHEDHLTAVSILRGHFSGKPFFNDAASALSSLRVLRSTRTNLCHSHTGAQKKNRAANDGACVAYRAPQGGTAPFFFASLHDVEVLLERRQRTYIGRVSFFRLGEYFAGQVDSSLVSYSVTGKPGVGAREDSVELMATGVEGYENDVAVTSVTMQIAARETDQNVMAKASTPSIKTASGDRVVSRVFGLSVMTFNVWNYNKNWPKRCRRIADIVKQESADVVTFQEVRCDTTRNDHLDDNSRYRYKFHSQCQSEHLMRHIRTKTPYWFAYHPAMLYFHTDSRPVRYEMEGPMILHRFHSVVATVPLLLTRLGREQGDDHHRMLLCTVMLLGAREVTRRDDEGKETVEKFTVGDWLTADAHKSRRMLRVDVCTAHYSLAQDSRLLNANESAVLMDRLARKTSGFADLSEVGSKITASRVPPADLTVFTGDLNAEPDDAAIDLLRSSGFKDAYDEVTSSGQNNVPPTPKAKGGKPSEPRVNPSEDNGFTFNANDGAHLSKRIDYILFKNHQSRRRDDAAGGQRSSSSLHVTVDSLYHMGHRIESERWDGAPQLVSDNASDHLAVIAKLKIREEVSYRA